MPLPHIISPWPSAVRRSPEASGAEHGWGSLWVGVCPQPAFTVFSRPETQDSINPSNPCHCGYLPLKGWQKWGGFFFCGDPLCVPAVRGGGHQVAAQCGLTPRLPHWPRGPEPSAGLGWGTMLWRPSRRLTASFSPLTSVLFVGFFWSCPPRLLDFVLVYPLKAVGYVFRWLLGTSEVPELHAVGGCVMAERWGWCVVLHEGKGVCRNARCSPCTCKAGAKEGVWHRQKWGQAASTPQCAVTCFGWMCSKVNS